jgi:hypothetical protein
MKLNYGFRVLVDTSPSIAVIVDIPRKRLAYHVLKEESALLKSKRSKKTPSQSYQAVKMM